MKKRKRAKASVWLLVGGLLILLLGLVVLLRGRGIAAAPGSAGQTGAWLSVRLFPDQQGWAVTVHGILHTTDDGQHWVEVTPWTSADYVFGGRMDELSSFLNGNEAWLVLPGRTIYVKVGQKQQPELARSFRTVDGGKTWQESTLPDTGSTYADTQSGAGFIGGIFNPLNAQGESRGQVSLHSIDALDGLRAWVAVDKTYTHTGGGQEEIIPEYSRIWQSSDGGKSWKLVMDEKPAANGGSRLDDGWIAFLNGTTGLMGGPTPDSVLVSHNGGATWKPLQLPVPHLTAQLLQRTTQGQASFFDGQNGVIPVRVLLDDQHTGTFEYITHDGARTWQMSSMQTLSTYGNTFCLDSRNWMVMPDSTTLLKTTDSGNTWSSISASISSAYLSNLTFVSPREGWAIGRNSKSLQGEQYNQDDSTALLKTTDGGKTWINIRYTVQNKED